jgi:copper chaperone NosL
MLTAEARRIPRRKIRPRCLRGGSKFLGIILICTAMLLLAATAWADEATSAAHPGPHDKCPVCGMFVARYPDFIASVRFATGATYFFDGVKDMFKFLHDLTAYAPGLRKEDIASMQVTEYYDMQSLDARKAIYVMGSDVLGPMGHELIPFKSEQDAQQFRKDHAGRRIVRFGEVTPALIQQLDR